MSFMFTTFIFFLLVTILSTNVNGLRLSKRQSQGISLHNTCKIPHRSQHISHKLEDIYIKKQYKYNKPINVKRRRKRRIFISIIENISMLPLLPLFFLGIISVNGILFFLQTIYMMFFEE